MSIFAVTGKKLSAADSQKLVADAIEKIRQDGEKDEEVNYSKFVYESLKYMLINVTDITETALVRRNERKMMWEIVISPKVDTLTEMVFVLLHEASHIIFGHFSLTEEEMMKYKDPVAVNIAHDAQLNSYIIDEKTKHYVAPIRHPEEMKGYSGLEDITEHLQWQKMYDDALKESKKHREFNEAVADAITTLLTGDRDASSPLAKSASTGNPDIDGIIDQKTREALGEVAKNIKGITYLAKGKKAGRIGAEVKPILDDTIKRTKVHQHIWQKILKKYLVGLGTNSSNKIHTYKRPNRRFGESARGTVKVTEQGKLGVLVDCSGSMCDTVMKAISDAATISSVVGGISRLVFWNTQLQAEFRNVKKSNLEKVLCGGYGGTWLSDGIRLLASDNISLLIILTDLELQESDNPRYNDFMVIDECSKNVPIVIGAYDGGSYEFKSPKVKIVDLDEEDVL